MLETQLCEWLETAHRGFGLEVGAGIRGLSPQLSQALEIDGCSAEVAYTRFKEKVRTASRGLSQQQRRIIEVALNFDGRPDPWTQRKSDLATLLGVDPRTIKRRLSESYALLAAELLRVGTESAQPKPPVEACRVWLRLGAGGSDDPVSVATRFTFVEHTKAYTVALVAGPSLCGEILARCPQIDEAWSFADNPDFEDRAKAALGEFKLGVSKNGDVKWRKARDLGRRSIARMLGPDLAPFAAKVRCATYVLSAAPTLHSLVCQHQTLRRPDCKSYYWVADRDIFLETISVDVESLTDPGNPNLGLTPFLPSFGMGQNFSKFPPMGVWEIECHHWIHAGHGIMVTW